MAKRSPPPQPVEMAAPPIVVFKLGGSLLDLNDLANRSRWLLDSIPACRPLFVVGGGPAADVVRQWHDQHRLGEAQSHWLAIRSLTITAALFCELLPGACIARDRGEANLLWEAGQFPVLEPYAFLQAEQALQALPLPCCWDTTTDSIAAWTASVWPASMLVLAKSVELPCEITGPQAVQLGLIDSELLNLLDYVPPVAWVNLRADFPLLTTWLRRSYQPPVSSVQTAPKPAINTPAKAARRKRANTVNSPETAAPPARRPVTRTPVTQNPLTQNSVPKNRGTR